MKKELLILSALLFAACESDVSEPSRSDSDSIDIVASVKDLPKCNDKNEGVQIVVKGETSVRVCVDGDWSEAESSTDPDTVFVDKDVSCKTEELKDKSGYRIVCNGDSVGVVLYETEAGKDTVSDTVYVDKEVTCKTEELKDKSGYRIVCNGDSVGVVLNGAEEAKDTVYVDSDVSCATEELADSSGLKIVCNGDSVGFVPYFVALDTTVAVPDSERIATDIDTLSGFAQKGPLMPGSSIYLYELSDGRTLSQTGVNYESGISRSNRFKFSSLKLQSQYAMLIAEGSYSNEVTGKMSTSSIRLRAISDLSKRSTANVNILTHLEFDRVKALVTSGKKTVAQAKAQARSELLSAFHVGSRSVAHFGDAEDLDIFGESEADAALLAISVLLLADLDESDFAELLTSLSSDIADDGVWEDSAAKVRIAEWAMNAEMSGLLKKIRTNVEGFFHVSDTVPVFEYYVRNFWQSELGVGWCDTSKDGDTVDVKNKRSSVKSLVCKDGAWNFITMRDLRDDMVYKVVRIGDQVWMAENLRTSTGNDGTLITVHCDTSVDPDFCARYGGLYTWEDAKKACPDGWRLPTKSDWETLVNTVDASNKVAGKKLKSKAHWNGSDDYGFAALPAGYWDRDDYGGFGNRAIFWSSTEASKSSASVFALYGEYDSAVFSSQLMDEAASVRCIKDN